ncbi:hypothetical protein HHK36_006627 [Tetracentron sinense]|uniref:Uncharacterized protein n=1 Tax=Tetracentron sinense TaxID=13715 RepID=A0A835DKH5_TETSI|nr:hypothetical protein HHK36_006627 [Tetracentron sinense]
MAEAEEEVGLGLGLGLGQGEAEGLSPWEQHSAVISIPRFDYNAPSSLLEHSHSGFLVTCTLKREKSATKEVISILEKYVGSSSSNSSECSESSDANESGKRRKTFSEEIDGECVNNANIKRDTAILGDSAGELSKETGLSFLKRDANVERDLVLSLVKLTRSGLILLTFPRNNFHDTVDIVSNVFHTLESGTLRSPLNHNFPSDNNSLLSVVPHRERPFRMLWEVYKRMQGTNMNRLPSNPELRVMNKKLRPLKAPKKLQWSKAPRVVACLLWNIVLMIFTCSTT